MWKNVRLGDWTAVWKIIASYVNSVYVDDWTAEGAIIANSMHWRIQGRAPGTRPPPLGVQILSFSCSFRQKIEK